jgi:hypothetical protein
MTDPETIWAWLLSRKPATARAAWKQLTREEQVAVYAHLQRMATEDGWSEPQRASAQAALDILQDWLDRADDT